MSKPTRKDLRCARTELFTDPIYIISIIAIVVGGLLTISIVGAVPGIIILVIGVALNLVGRARVKSRCKSLANEEVKELTKKLKRSTKKSLAKKPRRAKKKPAKKKAKKKVASKKAKKPKRRKRR